ncbi:pyridoxal phosphate-dependent aminotransferase [Nocardia takedensis]|uniref:pyridoxal phosphate-dependent aminotransferase n=1 Tax=Nocardia takedensis TaxID=259390 RepID=UPI003F75CEF4
MISSADIHTQLAVLPCSKTRNPTMRSVLRRQPTLTEYETAGLQIECNLADGHAKLDPDTVTFTPELLETLASARQGDLETEFLDTLIRHGSALPHRDVVFFPSASLAIDAVAKLLMAEERRRVALIEPTFDSLALLLKRAGATMSPLRENVDDVLDAVRTHDAVFLCVPNNPTGWHPGSEFWPRLGSLLERHDTVLVVDRTFKFLGAPDAALDELVENHPMVIAIEDTGKIWSTLECKVSMVVTGNKDMRELVREIGAEITLNVSPVSLYLCARVIEADRGAERLGRAIGRNAEILGPAMRTLGLTGVTALSFALAEIPEHFAGDDVAFVDLMHGHGLALLPVSKFFWSGANTVTNRVRISLARPERQIARAAEIMRSPSVRAALAN